VLAIYTEGPNFEIKNVHGNSLCSPSSKWVPALLRAGEGEGGEEKEWSPTSVTSLSVQFASL